jgi:predicted MPP superfamily phosphohydrolase
MRHAYRALGRTFPFEFGSFGSLFIRQESIRLGLPRPIRILYASDLHLGHWWTKSVPQQFVAAVQMAVPDLTLLGGDLIDCPDAIDELAALISQLNQIAPVYAIPGNHDECVGGRRLQAVIESGGGRWLPDHSVHEPIRIDGRIEMATSPCPRLLCAHYPNVFPAAVAAGYQVVLAGHLHGGQCVLATWNDKFYPAAWIDRWHGLRFVDGGVTMLVSRGAGDTLPLRFNCPREVLLCEIN